MNPCLDGEADVADRTRFLDDSGEIAHRRRDVTGRDCEARQLDLAEDRRKRKAGRAKRSACVAEHLSGFVEAIPADENLAEVGCRIRGLGRVADSAPARRVRGCTAGSRRANDPARTP